MVRTFTFFYFILIILVTSIVANCLHCPPVQVAKDVIKEFAADGVKYLELRSTPREEKNTGKATSTLTMT